MEEAIQLSVPPYHGVMKVTWYELNKNYIFEALVFKLFFMFL